MARGELRGARMAYYIHERMVWEMAWCPKCKTEYREGFTVCADCKSTLVSAEELKRIEKEQRIKSQLYGENFAEESAETEVITSENAEETQTSATADGQDSANDVPPIAMPGMQIPEGMKLPEGMTPEQAQAIMAQLQAAEMTRRARGGGSHYQSSEEVASDNRSSAWLLLVIGIVGLIVLALGLIGVIPLNFKSQFLFYCVLAALFVFFIVAGIVSLKNAKVFEKRAETENSLKNTLVDWVKENLKADEIDKMCGVTSNMPEELAYFRRYDCIKFKLNRQFVNLDQNFLDQFIDEFVYDAVYSADED